MKRAREAEEALDLFDFVSAKECSTREERWAYIVAGIKEAASRNDNGYKLPRSEWWAVLLLAEAGFGVYNWSDDECYVSWVPKYMYCQAPDCKRTIDTEACNSCGKEFCPLHKSHKECTLLRSNDRDFRRISI